MKILLVAVCYNEEYILPFFLNHYSKICDKILMYDNCSEDKSQEIIRSYDKAELHIFNTNGIFNEHAHIRIKNNEWKKYKEEYDWVISCDADEFLYHPYLNDLLELYMRDDITFPSIDGYNMSNEFLITDTNLDLTKVVKWGYPEGNFCKNILFNPKKIDVNFHVGAHRNSVVGDVKINPPDNYGYDLIKLLHYRYFGVEYFFEREKKYASRKNENLEWFNEVKEDPEKAYRKIDRGRGPDKIGLSEVI